MAKLTKTQRENHNRAIVLIMIALFTSAWVMINAGTLLVSGLLYIILLAISTFLYFVWSKF